MAPERPPKVMYARTKKADTMMAAHRGQPSVASSTKPSAYRLTPAISTLANANVTALNRWVGRLNRRRRYSGTLRTPEP